MKNIFQNMDALIRNAGTDDPMELLDYLGTVIVPMCGTVKGYVASLKNGVFVGYNTRQPYKSQQFTLMHECTHIVEHIPTGVLSAQHQEMALFTIDKTIAVEEREANLCAAEYTVPTEDVLELSGYNNSSVREFCRLKEEFDVLIDTYPPPKQKLKKLSLELEVLGSDIASNQCVHTNEQIARLLHYNEAFIYYKLEALRLRGYDIPRLELPDSHAVFGQR